MYDRFTDRWRKKKRVRTKGQTQESSMRELYWLKSVVDLNVYHRKLKDKLNDGLKLSSGLIFKIWSRRPGPGRLYWKEVCGKLKAIESITYLERLLSSMKLDLGKGSKVNCIGLPLSSPRAESYPRERRTHRPRRGSTSIRRLRLSRRLSSRVFLLPFNVYGGNRKSTHKGRCISIFETPPRNSVWETHRPGRQTFRIH